MQTVFQIRGYLCWEKDRVIEGSEILFVLVELVEGVTEFV